ncbi:hypothetical protein VTN77DRAFT_8066 [Rasamsonia byssochlamydoides]|uniref:uncharacterized protein n=1 Tax=Rasamsonia byssochlamydoides TaxID=89139 RepID=UPI00374361AB
MHLSTHTWMRPEPLERTLQRISGLGYRSVELDGEPAKYHPIETTRALLHTYGTSCWGAVTIMHGSRDLTAADPRQRADTVQYIKDVVAMAAALGGSVVTVVPATVGKIVPSSSPEDEWAWVVDGLREICAFAQTRNIRIGLEPLNRFETYFLNRVDQALRLADEVGFANCGITFDPFHLAIEERDMFAALRKSGPRIVDFHVSDNNRLAAGDGSFDWKRIVDTLREVGYKGALAVECMPPIDRTPASPYIAQGGQLETGPITDVPAETLQFLRAHGSWVLSDKYYTSLMERSAETILPLL